MSKKAKILVVDDEVQYCSLMQEYFSAEYDVATANDGREALTKLKDFQPDCVLLDMKMPNMDGLKTLTSIKSSYPDMKVIMISASGTTRIAEKCLEEGAFDYILKPIDLQELQNKLASALATPD